MSALEEALIACIASQLGLTYEQLTTPYPRQSVRVTIPDPLFQPGKGWTGVVTGYLWSTLMGGIPPCVDSIVGYNPQKLLPYHKPNYDLWDRETLASIIADLPASENVFASFFPSAGKPQRYYIEGGHFDMFAPGVFDPNTDTILFEHPPCRNLAPYIAPKGRISHPRFREERWEHKMAVVHLDIDYGPTEMRAIMQMLAEDRRVRTILLDVKSPGGEIAGNPQLSLYAQGVALAKKEHHDAVAKKAPPSYMKHDPTKQHRRRKRK